MRLEPVAYRIVSPRGTCLASTTYRLGLIMTVFLLILSASPSIAGTTKSRGSDPYVTKAKPLKPGAVEAGASDLVDRSLSVEVPEQGKVVGDDAFDNNDHTYFATFDATALSTAWLKLGGQQREYEDRVARRERSKKAKQGQSVAPETTPTEATVVAKPDIRLTKRRNKEASLEGQGHVGGAGRGITGLSSPHADGRWGTFPPTLTKEEEQQRIAQSQELILQSAIWKRMDPMNSMEFIHKQLPLVIYLMCGCAFDLQFARALSLIDEQIHRRRWGTRFTFTYIPVDAQAVFELTNTYRLDDNVITIGTCMEPHCPGNKKVVHVRFDKPFPAGKPPSSLTVSLFNECCGDKFSLSVDQLEHTGFRLTVTRTDGEKDKGWGQVLKARWATTDRYTLPGGVPAVVVDNVPMGVHMEKYVRRSAIPVWAIDTPGSSDVSTDVAKDIISFLEDFQVGNLPIVVRSQPVTADTESLRAIAGKGAPVEVVGNNFKELVLDMNRDVLLLIYSPFCGASRAIMPLFDQVAKSLAEVKDQRVFVAQFDKMQNDFPVTGIKVTHFPTVYYFPAGNYDSPTYRFYDYSDFNGSKQPHNSMRPHSHFTKEMILKFIYEHGKNADAWPTALAKEVEGYKPELYTHDHKHAGHH